MLTRKVDKPFECYIGAIPINGYNIRLKMSARYFARECEKFDFEPISLISRFTVNCKIWDKLSSQLKTMAFEENNVYPKVMNL